MRIAPPPARRFYMQYRGELGDRAQILQSSVHVLLNCTCTDDRRLLVFAVRPLLGRNNRVKNNCNYFITAVLRRKLCRPLNRCTMDASLTSPSAALTPPSQGGMGNASLAPQGAAPAPSLQGEMSYASLAPQGTAPAPPLQGGMSNGSPVLQGTAPAPPLQGGMSDASLAPLGEMGDASMVPPGAAPAPPLQSPAAQPLEIWDEQGR
jgi:hypothetical protein